VDRIAVARRRMGKVENRHLRGVALTNVVHHLSNHTVRVDRAARPPVVIAGRLPV